MAAEFHRITFLRHGESVGNLENRFQGQSDYPLTEKGRAQATALAGRWRSEDRSFDRAVSSPLLRARQTAEIICSALNIPLEFDPCWMEINNGLLAGLNGEEAEQVLPRPAFINPYSHTGKTGESRWELYIRASHNIQRLVDQPPSNLLVIAHGAILNMTMYAILGIPVQADLTGARFMFLNTSFATFTYDLHRHNWHLLHFEGSPHLEGNADG